MAKMQHSFCCSISSSAAQGCKHAVIAYCAATGFDVPRASAASTQAGRQASTQAGKKARKHADRLLPCATTGLQVSAATVASTQPLECLRQLAASKANEAPSMHHTHTSSHNCRWPGGLHKPHLPSSTPHSLRIQCSVSLLVLPHGCPQLLVDAVGVPALGLTLSSQCHQLIAA